MQHGLKFIEDDLKTHVDNLIFKFPIYQFWFKYEELNSQVVKGLSGTTNLGLKPAYLMTGPEF